MSNKIPFKDFFTSYNFIINRIKVFQSEQKQEILDAILERMNSKEMNKRKRKSKTTGTLAFFINNNLINC